MNPTTGIINTPFMIVELAMVHTWTHQRTAAQQRNAVIASGL